MASHLERFRNRQHGAAAVEFALIAIAFFIIFLGIIELGRMFYLYNTMQEATRNLARRAVVTSVTTAPGDAFRREHALFGQDAMPAGPEITVGNVAITYLHTDMSTIGSPPESQRTECITGGPNCVAFVRAEISNVTYQPMVAGLFPFLEIPLPTFTVTMPAESMGDN